MRIEVCIPTPPSNDWNDVLQHDNRRAAAKESHMIDSLPATIPEASAARLPANYEAARKAIAECDSLDECKTWSDKAAAIASYAQQAKDDSLRAMALRIQHRAQRRCGELLKEIPPAHGATQNIKAGDYPKVTRTLTATDAGLSEHQRKTALRIASVPDEEFTAAVESPKPPTVTQLAHRGRIARSNATVATARDDYKTPEGCKNLVKFVRFFGQHEPSALARRCNASDATTMRQYAAKADHWLERFVANLPPVMVYDARRQ